MNKKKNLLFSIKHACVGISLCCMVAGAEAAPTNSSVLSQKFDVELYLKNATLKSVVSSLKEQMEIAFSYDTALDVINVNNVSVNVKNENIQSVLDKVFNGTGISYRIEDKIVVLYRASDNKELRSSVNQQSTRKVTGVVKDATGEPVIGANVVVKGTTTGVITGMDGDFQLEAASNAVLVISYIGYLPQEVSIAGKSSVNVVLKEDTQKLEEVVVVGYGTQKKVNLTGAITSVDAESLENRPITNATQALQGTQGVYVNQAGAQPGADGATIRIRGQGTLNNNDPLVLVDGIEFPLSAINPNDIESISVLKDAASSAIYGSRAANGVVLVKTKSGKKGAFIIDYNNYFGVQKATYLPKFVYDPILFMEMRNQAQKNEGKMVVDYSQALIDEYREGMKTNSYVYPQNNWMDIMYNNAFVMEHNLRFSGGDEKYAYSMSFGYTDQNGVLRGTNSDKYTMAINTSAQINSRLKIGANLNAHYNEYNEPVCGVSDLVEMTYKAQAFHPTYLEDGRYADTFIRTPGHNLYRHPLAIADEGENQHKSLRMLANLSAEYKLPFDLMYNLNVGLNKYDYLNSYFYPEVYEYQVKDLSEKKIALGELAAIRNGQRKDENNLAKTIFMTLTWDKIFSQKHDIKALIGYSYEDSNDANFWARIEGFLGNELSELNAGSANSVVKSTSLKSALMSYFGRVNYGYDNRYLLEANVRYDASSRFSKANRLGVFPSFSAGWRVSEEGFMKEVDWMHNLKLRASWGQLGNERIDMFRYVSLMNLGIDYPLSNAVTSGAAVQAYNDPNITWETTTMYNAGLDASVLNGKLDFTFELFNKRTSDILRPVVLPDQVGGLDGPIRNIGTVDNRGFELALKYRDKVGDFNYELFGEATHINNKIIDLKGQTIIDGMFILKEGEPIDSYYMLHYIGIFQSEEEIRNSPTQTAATKPGYLKFEDTNNDGKITDDDRQIRGGVIPKFTYSFGMNFSYKSSLVSG
ncbi:SusC/RagA family TonB-linked outer membrane protein [Bacteroides graminisolvens]|uniref:SusC/RagA family TonB-linked outer membrane protein n=1 Tax=Bacteroides graminisolvens TaxID=477666 RepID=UPI0023F42FCA|nr:TonB-dependent receptor [Bacteroides graminisolvens]MDD3212007.1 TonB-dependent receptor [Bacteroides graminisolvens]